MPSATATTPFPLGAYLGNPDNSSAANEATFESWYSSFTQVMGAAPQFLDSYVDYTQPINQWVSNAYWAADSFAASPDAKEAIPVIGLAFSSWGDTSMTPDQYYKAFASGTYDSVIEGVVQAWASAGFKTQYWRPGWEFNLNFMPSYAGDDAQTQADWVAAFQHVSTVLHQAGQADGVNVQVVWNPGITNYTNAEATTNLYPGNSYVDVIGADIYADMNPYSLYDWQSNNGTIDSSQAQWMANPVNRIHYWNYPAATQWMLDGSSGHSFSLQNLLQFAAAQGKPVAIPETGAGNSNNGNDVADDAAFPQWLAQTLAASGDKVDFVNVWDSNGGGNYAFSPLGNAKPGEAAAWAQYFGAPTIVGSGPDTVQLLVSEDAWQGDAQFTVSVDGTQVGGTQTATASHAAQQMQTFDFEGNFGAGTHTVAVNFLNDAYGGSSSQDRNLYVDSASYDGTLASPGTLTLLSSGPQSLTVGTPATVLGTGSDSLTLNMSEDAWQGDAQFTVAVDGTQIGGTQTVTAAHAAGQDQAFVVNGNFGPGSHTVAVSFLNDAYGGSPMYDRNLYVDSASYDGQAVSGASLALLTTGTQSFQVSAPSSLTLLMSEDAWQGDAQFTVSVDGKQTGGVNTVTALHSTGATESFTFKGDWSSGSHNISVDFLNDAYGGSPAQDRNLYVNAAGFNGHSSPENIALYWGGPASFALSSS